MPVTDEAVTPFWRRMPQFFRFPAYRAPLVRNLALSVPFAGALALQSRAAASVVASVASLYLAHYGFVIIERVAQGYLHPDRFPAAQTTLWRPLKLAAIMLTSFFAVAVVAAVTGDGVLTLLADAVVALLFPASVMTLAVTNSLRQAINPRRVYALARRIGPPYLVLFLFLLLLVGGSQQAFELVAPALGESVWLLAFASSFVGNYFFFIICALMGYVLYQYSAGLGLPVIGPGEAATDWAGGGVESEVAPREAALARLVAAGDVDGAIGFLERALVTAAHDASLHRRLHRLLVIAGDAARIEAHLQTCVELLLPRDPNPVLDLLQDTGWTPASTDLVLRLSRVALDAHRYDLVLALTQDFEARHPEDDSLPTITLMRAEALSGQGKSEDAQGALRELAERLPSSEAASAARPIPTSR